MNILGKAKKQIDARNILSQRFNIYTDVNRIDDDGFTFLTKAIKNNDAELVRILLDAGADINKADQNGSTPLIRAYVEDNTELASFLVNSGADVNKIVNKVCGYEDITVLMLSCHHGDAAWAKFFLESGTDINITNKSGKTALQIAKENGNEEIIALLKRYGAKE